MMRLLIDAQPLQTESALRGIGRYVDGLIRGLASQEKVEVFVLMNGRLQASAEKVTERLHGVVKERNIVQFFPMGDICSWNCTGFDYFLSQRLYWEAVRQVGPDVFVCGSVFEPGQQYVLPPLTAIQKNCLVSVVWYDGIPLGDPGLYLGSEESMRTYLNSLAAIDGADLMWCNSDHSRNEVKAIKPYIGADTVYGASFDLPVQQQKRENFIFYCGGLDPRKNVPFLIEAYAGLPASVRKAHPLAICCRKNRPETQALSKFVEQSPAKETIGLVEAHDDATLAQFYATCWLFVFPSLSEGLGLSVIEAMNYKAPVLCSNATSLKEVWDLPAGQFDPHNKNELTELLIRCATDNVFYRQLEVHSEKHCGAFTWDKTAQRCMASLSKKGLGSNSRSWKGVEPISLDRVGLSELQRVEYELSLALQCRMTWYVDLSEYWNRSQHAGPLSTVENFNRYASEFLKGKNIDIVFVAGDHKFDTYRILRSTEAGWQVSENCHPVKGDCFIALGSPMRTQLERLEEILRWKKQGVRIFSFVHELTVGCSSDKHEAAHSWLRLVLDASSCVMSDSPTALSEIQNLAKILGIGTDNVIFLPCLSGKKLMADRENEGRSEDRDQSGMENQDFRRASVGNLIDALLEVLSTTLADPEKPVFGTVSSRSMYELLYLRDQGHLDTTSAPALAEDCSDYILQKVKYALMRKLATTAEKRRHYDRKWRLLRQRHSSERPQLSREMGIYTEEELRRKILAYALLRRISLTKGKRICCDRKYQGLKNIRRLLANFGCFWVEKGKTEWSFGKKRSRKVALFCTMPPDDTGIAHFNERLVSSGENLFAFVRRECATDPKNRIYPIEAYDEVNKAQEFALAVFVIGNSHHNEWALEQALQWKNKKEAWLYLHEAELKNLWMAFCGEDLKAMNLIYQKSYGKGQLGFGIRPLVQATGIRNIIVNNSRCRDTVINETKGLGVRVEELFHPIEVPVGLGRRAFPEKFVIGTFGIPHPTKATETVLSAVHLLCEKHRGEVVLVLAGYYVRNYFSTRDVPEFVRAYDSPSDDELAVLMNSVDVGVQLRPTSHGESSGCISQLLGLGKKVVSTQGFPPTAFVGWVEEVPPDVTPEALADVVWKTLHMTKKAPSVESYSFAALGEALSNLSESVG